MIPNDFLAELISKQVQRDRIREAARQRLARNLINRRQNKPNK